MLAIRMQRTGRSGHAQFRVIVQDSRAHPTRGKVIAYVGNYNPHTKNATLDGEKIDHYLTNGAQPSDRVARLLQKEGLKLPVWVKLNEPKERSVRSPDKRRSTRPTEPAAETPATESEAATEEAAAPEVPATENKPAGETPAEPGESAESDEAPAEENTDTPAPAEAAAEPAVEEKPAENSPES